MRKERMVHGHEGMQPTLTISKPTLQPIRIHMVDYSFLNVWNDCNQLLLSYTLQTIQILGSWSVFTVSPLLKQCNLLGSSPGTHPAGLGIKSERNQEPAAPGAPFHGTRQLKVWALTPRAPPSQLDPTQWQEWLWGPFRGRVPSIVSYHIPKVKN